MRRIDTPVHNPRRALGLVLVALTVVVAAGIAVMRLAAADHYTRAEYVADCTRQGTAVRSCGCRYDALLGRLGRRQVDAMEHPSRGARAAAIAFFTC